MRYWVTPFQLSATALSTLNASGLQPWPQGWSGLPDADSLLLYDSPDQLIAMVGAGPETEELTAHSLLHGYRSLLSCSDRTGQPLLAISQLQRLGPKGLRNWFADGDAASPSPPLPIPPLLASVCLGLLMAEPALLDCYNDLELRAVLLGRDPDLRYRERVLEAGQQGDALLQAFLANQRVQSSALQLEQRLASRDTELREAREASGQTSLELQQVQEALERYVQADVQKGVELEARARELEAVVRDLEELRRTKGDLESAHDLAKAAQESEHQQELEALRQQLEPRLAELEQQLASRDTELREAREASGQTSLELQQVQEALERYVQADVQKGVELEARARELESVVRDLEELRRTKADLESAHDLAKAAQEREHQQELEALRQQLEALRQQLEPRLAELEQCLASRDTELREAREAAEISVLQLHQQVQEERERHSMAEGEMQRQFEAVVRDLEELRRIKTAQESANEQAKSAQASAHEQELEALRQRLEPQLAELEQRLISRDTELREAREAAELSLLQLHQVQEELEHYFLADAEKQRQLEDRVRDLEDLRRLKTAQESAHELAKAELEQGLASRDTQLRQAREEAEMTFEQLHQAQEELEHYFLKARAGDQLAQSQMEQLQRAQSLMVRLNPDVLPNAPYPPALAVEVLSELPAAMPDPSLQTQALLSTYAASLQRASALLQRARRS